MSLMGWGERLPIAPGAERPRTTSGLVCLPTEGRLEREILYKWMVGEEAYAHDKWDAEHEKQREEHDRSMREFGMDDDGFWFRQIVQYIDRAEAFLQRVREIDVELDELGLTDRDKFVRLSAQQRTLEMKAQQALAKTMMTMKGCVESSIRVFGPLPRPGVESGEIQEWDEGE